MTSTMTSTEQLELACRLAAQLRMDSIRCSTQAGDHDQGATHLRDPGGETPRRRRHLHAAIVGAAHRLTRA